MKRHISLLGLCFASISAIIGSGWLFAAFYTAQNAGPSALLSWVLGGAAVIIIAFVFAELSAMLPITGTISRIPHYTHGTLVSFTFTWIIWLSYVALMATEVQAVVQYMDYYFPNLTHGQGALTQTGYAVAGILMVIITCINVFSVRWLMRCNTALTVMKIIIPVFISIAILAICFAPHRILHAQHSSFMPFGFKGVLAAISTGGIVFAFNGFKQACELAGEAHNPQRALPIAIIGSISVCLLIYLLLQSAFLSSLGPANLMLGWHRLSIPGSNSPLAGIIEQNHMTWLQPILYTGAIIGPLAAALMYTASAGRSLYAMSKNDYVPLAFEMINKKGIPWLAIIFNLVVGMLMFAPLPGWNKMITFLASLMAISYAIAPICFIALRSQLPNQRRPLKLPFGNLWATIAFYFCNLLTYWSGWAIISMLGISLLCGFVILFAYHFFTPRGRQIQLDAKASIWIWPYFGGIILISYLGNFGGGHNVITFGWDFAIIAIFSVFIAWLAAYYRRPNQAAIDFVKTLKIPQ